MYNNYLHRNKMNFKDNRRSNKFNKTNRHFNVPRTVDKRQIYQQTARDTLVILRDETYQYGTKTIDISKELKYAIENTTTYNSTINLKEFKPRDTKFSVYLETTLDGCLREYDTNSNVCALNFASAKNAGGGFLNGSNAQEESLARATGLYACIEGNNIYRKNKENSNNCLYSHDMIYSPKVPVFRDNDDNLIEEPYYVSFITAPAVNAKEALKRNVSQRDIDYTMYERISRLFSIALDNEVDVLVLGSWGCGVFGGDVEKLAGMFCELLENEFKGAFEKVVFSTLSNRDYSVFASIFR